MVDNEALVEDIRNCSDGDKCKALGMVASANLQKETEQIKQEAESEREKKSRFVKILLGVLSFVGTVGLGIFNIIYHGYRQDVMMGYEVTNTPRSHAWKMKEEKLDKVNIDNR